MSNISAKNEAQTVWNHWPSEQLGSIQCKGQKVKSWNFKKAKQVDTSWVVDFIVKYLLLPVFPVSSVSGLTSETGPALLLGQLPSAPRAPGKRGFSDESMFCPVSPPRNWPRALWHQSYTYSSTWYSRDWKHWCKYCPFKNWRTVNFWFKKCHKRPQSRKNVEMKVHRGEYVQEKEARKGNEKKTQLEKRAL